jgi:hypothetical protein
MPIGPPQKKKVVKEREHTTSIGNYLLSKTIGEGTFGKVCARAQRRGRAPGQPRLGRGRVGQG